MSRLSWIQTAAVFFGMAVLATFNPGCARQSPAPTLQAPSAAPPADAIEPDALEALNRMGAYLRSLNSFSLQSETTIDEVTDDGMKLQFGGTVTMQVKRPNGLHAELNSDRKHRQLYYDGKTLTLYGERIGYYATVPAPETLKETVEAADQQYGIRLPLTELFYWGTDASSAAAVKDAAIIGPSGCGNVVCDHVAVRQEGVDWQIWIERGETPVPRKLVITTTSEPEQPQYIAIMQWNTAPNLDAATFRFVPPKDAYQIPLQDVDASPVTK